MKMRDKLILLIEDNEKVQDYNKQMLEAKGFNINTAITLAEAWKSVKQEPPDAVVLDIGLPDGSGLDFLREFRQSSNTPVLLLTGYGKDEDVILGFECGCSDYLTKPYAFGVLLVRLNNLLKNAERVQETITKGALSIDTVARRAYLNGTDLNLQSKQFGLLHTLAQHENQTLSAEYLYETVWGQPMVGNSQALRKAIYEVRGQLAGSGYSITHERNEGYKFERGE